MANLKEVERIIKLIAENPVLSGYRNGSYRNWYGRMLEPRFAESVGNIYDRLKVAPVKYTMATREMIGELPHSIFAYDYPSIIKEAATPTSRLLQLRKVFILRDDPNYIESLGDGKWRITNNRTFLPGLANIAVADIDTPLFLTALEVANPDMVPWIAHTNFETPSFFRNFYPDLMNSMMAL